MFPSRHGILRESGFFTIWTSSCPNARQH